MPRPPLYGFALGRNLGLDQERQRIGALHAALQAHGVMQENELLPFRKQELEQKLIEGALMNSILKQYGGMGGSGAPGGGPSVSPEAALAQGAAVGDVGPTVTNAQRMTQGAPMPMRPGGGTGLEPPRDVQGMLMHPLLKDRGKVLAEAYKPTPEMRALVARGVVPGSPQWNAELGTRFTQSGAWTVGPGGEITMAPGYAAGQGAVKGAEAAAQAPYQIKERTIGGRPVSMSDADYATLYGPDQLAAVQVAQRFGIPYNGGQVAPQASPQPAPQPAAAPSPPSAPRPGVSPVAPGAPIPTGRVIGPPVNPTGAEAAASTETAKADSQLVTGYRQKIPSVTSTLRRLDRLEALNTDDTTFAAAGAEFKTTLGSIGQSLGLNIGNIKTANSELYLAQIGELMKDRLGSKDYGSGSGVSNLDLLAARQPLPELARTQQGRAAIIQAIRADTQASLEDMNAARAHFDRNLSLSGFQFPSEVNAQVRGTRPGDKRQPASARGRVVKWSDL